MEPAEPKTLRDRMREQSGRKRKAVTVPLVGEVTIQNLSAREQIELGERVKGLSDLDAMGLYICACLLDEQDQPAYSESELDEVLSLDPRILATLTREIRDLCGLDIGVRTAAKN